MEALIFKIHNFKFPQNVIYNPALKPQSGQFEYINKFLNHGLMDNPQQGLTILDAQMS